jgi:hypothetical protein
MTVRRLMMLLLLILCYVSDDVYEYVCVTADVVQSVLHAIDQLG